MLLNTITAYEGTLSAVQGTLTAPTGNVYYTSSDFYDALARGEKLVVQLIIDAAPTPSGEDTVSVRLIGEHSNDGKVWVSFMRPTFTIPSEDTPFALPASDFFSTEVGGDLTPLGSKVRFRILADKDNVVVRLIVAVRGEAGR